MKQSPDFELYCIWCGKGYSWNSFDKYRSAFGGLVCCKTCYDQAELGYARYILGKPVR